MAAENTANAGRADIPDPAPQTRLRWNELARAGVAYSRPWLDLTVETARRRVDPEGLAGDLSGKRVLCLAGAGGQQSAAFAMLGAEVTVHDLSDEMLARDREALDHFSLTGLLNQGDMRDLSMYGQGEFDLVWHGHSINFVPDPRRVFAEVARVLAGGGLYRLSFHAPLAHGCDCETWTGAGYLLTSPCVDGPVALEDECWQVPDKDGTTRHVPGPAEFRHTWPTLLNGLIGAGLGILGCWEGDGSGVHAGDLSAPGGSWEHYVAFCHPFMTLWARRA
jgi:SAM-dependent methyltransferase